LNKNDLIPFGFLGKPHGLKGNVSIRFFNEKSKLLRIDDKIFFKNQDRYFLTIKDINYNSKKNLIRFIECSSRNEIEKFSNEKFYISKDIFPELENDENYFIDYIDCYLFDQNENRIGKIVDVVPIQGNDVLLIDTNLGQKMVPFAKQLILFFDKNSKKLVMTLHKGILE
tara:strand:- start:4293 stop:4802 length:510 start_codon:yes stop_codon:yes gene_type:complete